MLGSVSPRKLLAPFTATKTEAMIGNHKESLEHWDLKTSDLTPSIACKATDKVYHNSVVLATSNINISSFSSGFFKYSKYMILTLKLGPES